MRLCPAQVGVPINLAALYDDIGDAYPWVIKLPVQVRSSDMLSLETVAFGRGLVHGRVAGLHTSMNILLLCDHEASCP